MSAKDRLMLMIVGFVGLVVLMVVTRLSTDALGVVVGIALGLAATVPALVLLAWLAGRNSAAQPPDNGARWGAPPYESLPYRDRRRLPARRAQPSDVAARSITAPRRERGRRADAPIAYGDHRRPPREVIVWPPEDAYPAYDDYAMIGGEADAAAGDDDADLW